MGKLGLRKAAELCWHKAHYLAARISLLPGCSIENRLFFKEFTVRLPVPAQDASSSLARAGFVPGLSLSSLYPERSNELLVAVTEMNPRAQLDAFAAAIKECL
jgi:glycine dehydrogenase subunit 1